MGGGNGTYAILMFGKHREGVDNTEKSQGILSC